MLQETAACAAQTRIQDVEYDCGEMYRLALVHTGHFLQAHDCHIWRTVC